MASAGAVISGDASCRMRQDVPPTIYQTLIAGGVQDSSSPLILEIEFTNDVRDDLARAMRSGKQLGELIYGTVRRVDNQPLLVWRPESAPDDPNGVLNGQLVPLLLMPSTFNYALNASILSIKVHRKYLPVSKCHGDAPLVFLFAIKLPDHPAIVVRTSPFFSASKEPTSTRPAEPKVLKRKRNAPGTKPVAAPLSADDLLISAAFPGVQPPIVSSPSLPLAVRVSRVRESGKRRRKEEAEDSSGMEANEDESVHTRKSARNHPASVPAPHVTLTLSSSPWMQGMHIHSAISRISTGSQGQGHADGFMLDAGAGGCSPLSSCGSGTSGCGRFSPESTWGTGSGTGLSEGSGFPEEALPILIQGDGYIDDGAWTGLGLGLETWE